jgi:hypothetical protein
VLKLTDCFIKGTGPKIDQVIYLQSPMILERLLVMWSLDMVLQFICQPTGGWCHGSESRQPHGEPVLSHIPITEFLTWPLDQVVMEPLSGSILVFF